MALVAQNSLKITPVAYVLKLFVKKKFETMACTT
jgi:hypothetical protein